MDKVLRLYKIPEFDLLVRILGVFDDAHAPENGKEGDLYVNSSDNKLYKYTSNTWQQTPIDTSLFYFYNVGEVPYFIHYISNEAYEYVAFPFPDNSKESLITTFTYSSTRMGNAPTISATFNHERCLDDEWTDRVCTMFNGVFFFIDKIPASEYSNTDTRYKHTISFTSERLLLENVYFENVVNAETFSSEEIGALIFEYSFFGDIAQFVSRLDECVKYKKLSQVGFRVVLDTDEYTSSFIDEIEEKEQLISISNQTLKASLDLIYSTWGVPYYFDGYTIHIGFSNEAAMQASGVSMPTFKYGAVNSLLSIKKDQNNNIVNRITGFGGSENLPYYYPNKNPKNLSLHYSDGSEMWLNRAYIANPYRLSNVEPTTDVHLGVPDGTYFRFGEIYKQHVFDTNVITNTQHNKVLGTNNSGETIILSLPVDNPDIYAGYGTFTPNMSNQSEWYGRKIVYMFIKDGQTESFTLKDECDIDKFAPMPNITHNMSQSVSVYLNVYTWDKDKDFFDAQGWNQEPTSTLISKTCTVTAQLLTNDNGGKTKIIEYVWDDGSTSPYNEVANFAFSENDILEGTKCIILDFKVEAKIKNENYTTIKAKLRNSTRTIGVQKVLSTDFDWSKNGDGHIVTLYKYGIRLNYGFEPQEGDIIYFTKDGEVVKFTDKLMPYIFRESGDYWINAKNNTHHKEGSSTDYYSFENLYKPSCAKESVSNNEDIKPTIKGVVNNQTPSIRIDKFRDIAFDADDNNELAADGETYLHPYFYVKLAQTSMDDDYSFNLFDCAVEDQTMQVSMTSGDCGACTFEIMVQYGADGFARNPIGVYSEDTIVNGVTYAAGTPIRDDNGNVRTNLYQEAQQDTRNNEVWIALKKDAETFAPETLPSKNGLKPTTDDTFVLLNIRLPFAYIIDAEKRLYYALLEELQEENRRKYSFSLKFSSIYYKQNYPLMDKWLNEAALVPFSYNNSIKKYFVQSYSYKVTNTTALPEVTIELQEKPKSMTQGVYWSPDIMQQQMAAFTTETPTPLQSLNSLKTFVKNVINETNIKDTTTLNNLVVSDDITLSDGTSLNAQISSVLDKIYKLENGTTREDSWNTVSQRTEIKNLFVDGAFENKYNTLTANNARYTSNDDNSLRFHFVGRDATITFDQQLYLAGDTTYTISFNTKSTSRQSTGFNVIVDYYNEDGKIIGNSTESVYTTNEDWQTNVKLLTTPDEDFAYAKIRVLSSSDIPFDFDKLMVFEDDYTTYDPQYGKVASSMLPTDYVRNEAEYVYQKDLTVVGNQIKHGLREYWDKQTNFIPEDGEVIIYDNYSYIEDKDGNLVAVPNIKIGSGNAYIQDLPFVNDDIRIDLLNHINNTEIHISQEERLFWNDKLNVDDNNEVVDTTLIFNRN